VAIFAFWLLQETLPIKVGRSPTSPKVSGLDFDRFRVLAQGIARMFDTRQFDKDNPSLVRRVGKFSTRRGTTQKLPALRTASAPSRYRMTKVPR